MGSLTLWGYKFGGGGEVKHFGPLKSFGSQQLSYL